MSKNMSSQNEAYDEAAKKYKELNDQNTAASLKANKEAIARAEGANRAATAMAIKEQKRFQDKLKKSDIYGDAFKQASRTAEGQAAAAGAQAQKAARQSGLSKAAAAEAGANARQQTLGNAINQQQQNAMGAAMNKLGMQQSGASEMGRTAMQGGAQSGNLQMQGAGNTMSALGQQVANQGSLLGAQQQEGQNRYNRAWGNFSVPMGMIGGTLQAFSDENLKDAVDNNECPKCNGNKWGDVDAILKKHQGPHDFKKLIIVQEK